MSGRAVWPWLRPALYLLLVLAFLSLSVSIAVSSVMFGLAAAAYIALAAADPAARFRTPIDYAVLAYAGAELVATVCSIDRPASVVNMKRFFLILLVPMTMTAVSDRKKLRTVLLLLLGFGALLSAGESADILAAGAGSERLGIFQHYMTAGGIKMFFLLMLVPFIVGKGTPQRVRLWSAAAFVPILLALALTETRSSWIGLAGGIAVYGLMRDRRIVGVLAAGILLLILAAPEHWRERAFSSVDIHHYSNVERLNKWQAGWRMFLDYPVAGVGDIDLGQIYDRYKNTNDATHGGHLHNNVMMLLVTLGIIGLAAAAWLFVAIWLAEWRAAAATRGSWLEGNTAAGAVAAYVGFQINGLFEWNFGDHEIAFLLWLTLGLALAAAAIVRREGA